MLPREHYAAFLEEIYKSVREIKLHSRYKRRRVVWALVQHHRERIFHL